MDGLMPRWQGTLAELFTDHRIGQVAQLSFRTSAARSGIQGKRLRSGDSRLRGNDKEHVGALQQNRNSPPSATCAQPSGAGQTGNKRPFVRVQRVYGLACLTEYVMEPEGLCPCRSTPSMAPRHLCIRARQSEWFCLLFPTKFARSEFEQRRSRWPEGRNTGMYFVKKSKARAGRRPHQMNPVA